MDKVNHSTAVSLLSGLGEIAGVGTSLGSFSVSAFMLFGLLEEFKEELLARKGKLDSDPHLWMPMTLDKNAYIQLMKQKEVSEEVASIHYDRIQNFLEKFNKSSVKSISPLRLFGAVNVGQSVAWWDYGQLKLYQRNAMLMAEK